MSPPRLIDGLARAEKSVRREIRSGSTRGISASGYGVLFYLGRHPGASGAEVTAALGGSPAGMSGLLGRLADAGLVERAAAVHDRRASALTLTAAGERECALGLEAVDDLNEWLRTGFTTAELAIVDRWLAHVAAGRPTKG